ncbi:hypothetical protein GCM10023083_29470 [Streptomyces phyllanthi]
MRCLAEKSADVELLASSGSADAGLVIPAARATAAAVAIAAVLTLFTCLRKSPPGAEVRTT